MNDLPGIVYVLLVVASCAFGVWWGRHYADAANCELCGADVSVCPHCVDALREAFKQERK